jgi:beta-alanine degradation protein BauB
MKHRDLIAMGVASILALAATIASAQDAAKTDPDKNKVLFENDRVRVLEVTSPVGGTLKMHSHPAHVLYFLEGAKSTMTTSDGKVTQLQSKKGEARWVEPVTHKVENTGTVPIHAIVIELKDAAK